jgi:alanine racemase
MLNSHARCWAEIDSTALAANVQLLKKFHPELMAVVKADAYGHGVGIVVPLLLQLGVRHFAIATVEEGEELRAIPGMEEVNIYLMTAVLAEDVERIIELDLVPFSTDTKFVEALSGCAVRNNRTAKVHVEVDTGIGRAGIAPDLLHGTLTKWQSLHGILVTGICTHFTAADSDTPNDALNQQKLFEETLSRLPEELIEGKTIHLANSPATLRVSTIKDTFFRPGLLLYGIAPSPGLGHNFPFQPVLSLKAKILLVRRLPAGTDISYSRSYTLAREATIATIGIGYGDGYPRRLSNIGHILLPDGTQAPIRGRVCMDQLCVELPDSSLIRPGDTVTLIGAVAANTISVGDIAAQIDTTPHEITTCLTARVPRMLA